MNWDGKIFLNLEDRTGHQKRYRQIDLVVFYIDEILCVQNFYVNVFADSGLTRNKPVAPKCKNPHKFDDDYELSSEGIFRNKGGQMLWMVT